MKILEFLRKNKNTTFGKIISKGSTYMTIQTMSGNKTTLRDKYKTDYKAGDIVELTADSYGELVIMRKASQNNHLFKTGRVYRV